MPPMVQDLREMVLADGQQKQMFRTVFINYHPHPVFEESTRKLDNQSCHITKQEDSFTKF